MDIRDARAQNAVLQGREADFFLLYSFQLPVWQKDPCPGLSSQGRSSSILKWMEIKTRDPALASPDGVFEKDVDYAILLFCF